MPRIPTLILHEAEPVLHESPGMEEDRRPISWRRACVEQKIRMLDSVAFLIQLPLFHAITYMQNRTKTGEDHLESPQNFTMAGSTKEVNPLSSCSRR